MSSFRHNRNTRRPDSPTVAAKVPTDTDAFRVLIAVHRPRYRVRAERAAAIPGWHVRSLLNKEDPIGLINQNPPNVLIVSDDFGRQKDMGIVKAVQRFRAGGLKIIGLFEKQEAAGSAGELCDRSFCPPWKTGELRSHLTQIQLAVMAGGQP